MDKPKFSKICREAVAGESRYLENTQTHHAGKLLSCMGEKAEVEIFGKHETWKREDCQAYQTPEFDYRI
jgi:hypothetical protein